MAPFVVNNNALSLKAAASKVMTPFDFFGHFKAYLMNGPVCKQFFLPKQYFYSTPSTEGVESQIGNSVHLFICLSVRHQSKKEKNVYIDHIDINTNYIIESPTKCKTRVGSKGMILRERCIEKK